MSDPILLSNLVDGQRRAPAAQRYLDVHEPATGARVRAVPGFRRQRRRHRRRGRAARVPGLGGDSGRATCAALARSPRRPARRAISTSSRDAESRDAGKPLAAGARRSTSRARSANLRFFAAAITQFASEAHRWTRPALNYTLRQPLGVVACISPWNLPLYLFTWKIAPALAAGNTVVAKPSEVTPVHARALLGELAIEVGFPPGVLNIVHGQRSRRRPGAGRASPASRRSRSPAAPRTGARDRRARPRRRSRSCRWNWAARTRRSSSPTPTSPMPTLTRSCAPASQNQGEICLCGSRILVERSIYDAFRDAFRRARAGAARRRSDGRRQRSRRAGLAGAFRQGDRLHRARARRRRPRALRRARGAGRWPLRGRLVRRADRDRGPGAASATNQEEIFGPVVDAAARSTTRTRRWRSPTPAATASPPRCGPRDLDRAHRLAAQLDVGIVWINCWLLRDLRTPFGGVKQFRRGPRRRRRRAALLHRAEERLRHT